MKKDGNTAMKSSKIREVVELQSSNLVCLSSWMTSICCLVDRRFRASALSPLVCMVFPEMLRLESCTCRARPVSYTPWSTVHT